MVPPSPRQRQQSMPEKLENAAVFHRLGLPSTLIHCEKGTFRIRSSSRGKNLKTPAFRFCEEKPFENGAFRKRGHDNFVISLTEFSLNTNAKP